MEYWHPHSRTVSISLTVSTTIDDRETYVVPLSHPEGPWSGKTNTWDKDAPWRRVLFNIGKAIQKNEGIKWSAHNAKYETNWHYAMTGQALENSLWWDTCMSDYLLDENELHSLKEVAVRDLDVDRWDEVDLKSAEKVSWDSLALYNARDTDYCLRLIPLHKERLMQEERLARLFHFLAMPLIRTLCKMERNGLPLDIERVKQFKKESEDIRDEMEDHLLSIAVNDYGMDMEDYPTISFSGTSKFFKAFMEKAEAPVISYTPTGAPSWTEDNLRELERQGYDVAKYLMLARKHSNRLSKFFIPWTTKLASDGRLYPTYNPMIVDDKWQDAKGTTTGRLSSSNPNAQQINRDLKICFGGEEGWYFVELDYSQIELRIAAWVANDQAMLEAFRKDIDIHTLMASEITGKSLSKVTPEERQSGKAGNFGFLYEMGEDTYMTYAYNNYGVRVTLEEATKVRKAFFRRWSDLERWHQRQKNLAFKNGFVRNPFGRKRRLPDIYSSNGYEISRAERRAINAPIQSGAFDLMAMALIEIDRQVDPDRVRLVGTVHDSLLAQIRVEALDEELPRIATIMLDPGTKRKFGITVGVLLAVEAKVGYYWNDPDGITKVFK